MVAFLLAAGANVNIQSEDGDAPLFHIHTVSESTIDVVTTLLRAGASLDRQGSIRSFEEYLDIIVEWNASHAEHVDSIRTLVASVRAAGSWKAHCRLAHKQVLRLRSLVVRGRAKLPSSRRHAGRELALNFLVRQGDNGIVWNILSYWRETG